MPRALELAREFVVHCRGYTSRVPNRFTVAVNDEPELVRAGLAEMLDTCRSSAAIVEGRFADVVLVDPFPPTLQSPAIALQRVQIAKRAGSKIVAYTWDLTQTNHILALCGGCAGFASKQWQGQKLFDYLGEILTNPEVAMPLFQMSGRQLEIARAVAHGKSNAEIAAENLISVETVKTELQAITMARGLRNRAHLSSWVTATGLVHA